MTAVEAPLSSHRPLVRVRVDQIGALTRRAALETWRNPGAWVPGIVFPLVMAAVYAAQFSRVTDLPTFPEVESFLQFILPSAILQGISFNSSNAGTDMANDIETGFYDRLMASPVPRQSILLGRVGGAALSAAAQAAILMLVFLAFGAPVESGVPGALAVVVIAVLLSIGLSGIGLAVAMRTGSAEATQSLFPLIFLLIFVSSAFFPTEMMKGWYQSVAEVNPFTFIVNPTRQLVIAGWSWGDLGASSGGVVRARGGRDGRRLPCPPRKAAPIMTATLARGGTHAPFVSSVLELARRNIVRMTRVPAILVPMIVMPAFFVVAFTGSFDGVSQVEGFPTPKLVNWVAAFALLQGASFAGVGTAGASRRISTTASSTGCWSVRFIAWRSSSPR